MALSVAEIMLIKEASLAAKKAKIQAKRAIALKCIAEQKRERNKRRRDDKKAARIRDAKFAVDQHCYWCNKKLNDGEQTADHIIELSKGGETTEDNIVVACGQCNNNRSNQSPKRPCGGMADTYP